MCKDDSPHEKFRKTENKDFKFRILKNEYKGAVPRKQNLVTYQNPKSTKRSMKKVDPR